MKPSVRNFVLATVLVASGAAALALRSTSFGDPMTIALWTLVAIVSQLLIFPTLTGAGQISMSTCTHVTMLLVLRPGEFLPALALGRLVVALYDRKPWYRSLFNAAQVTFSVLAGWWVYRTFGGLEHFSPTAQDLALVGPAYLAGSATYYLINVASVSQVISLSGGGAFLEVWKKNYGYRSELVGTTALVLLAPIAAITYRSLGAVGLFVFLLPMLFIADATRRYIELRRTQEKLVHSERQAAKAELAADVGRDINNYLCVAQAHIQMVLLRQDMNVEERERRLGSAIEQIRQINTLSRGLLDFKRRKAEEAPANLAELVRDTIDFLEPQSRFQKVLFRVERTRQTCVVTMDTFQMKQALMNLMIHAAESMEAVAAPERVITVRTGHSPEEGATISVRYSGPGLPAAARSNLRELRYSPDDAAAHDLFVVASIIRGHQGMLTAEDAPGGAEFRITLPALGHATPQGFVNPVNSTRSPSRAVVSSTTPMPLA